MTPADDDSLPAILRGYALQSGVADELFDAGGRMRPVWRRFIAQLAALSPEAVAMRFARGDQYLRDAGVYFRLYSGGPVQDREWPLSHVPVLISESDWGTICDGLSQRAELLERVMADLYGPGDLVAGGHLPAELVAGNAQWLRPVVGLRPRSGHWLHHLAFEIGRSPDGSFLVLGDRAQAPSGSGFALENRMATMRIFSEPFSRSHIHRLAGFFRAFSDAMEQLAGPGRGKAILTPGPNNDTYYEHTYIARYLGMTLLEGEDLIVRDGQAMVRTVNGLEPLGLLWRRIDSEFADPLELAEGSRIGTPGLIEALRQRNLSLVNALGSGLIEARAFMAFLPRICQHLMGEPLRMPNIATWWCGQPAERAHVQKHAERMMIGAALEPALPFAVGAHTALGGQFVGFADGAQDGGQSDPGSVASWIAANGPRLVGQEAVSLSTTPAWDEGRLVPRPMTIRVFAARKPDGSWTFMPGGYARIGKSGDTTALAMQAGGSVADVWVLSPRPVRADTMVAPGGFERAPAGILPTRAAENLYWLGRYIERTEGAIRLLRAWHLRLAETQDPEDLRLREMAELMALADLDVERPVPEALIQMIASARSSAAKVRDRFSPDGWAALNDLAKSAGRMTDLVRPGDDASQFMSILLRKISGFTGLVHENMYHFAGWRFLSLGRAQERADGTLMLLAAFTAPGAAPGMLEVAIEVCDSVMTHQRRYRFGPSRETVLDLLALDMQNPRAVLNQIAQMQRHVARLPHAGAEGRLSPLEQVLRMLETDLRVSAPDALSPARLEGLRQQLARAYELISATLLR